MAAADPHEVLMQATYRALCTHGYASLTMQDIATEAGRSSALLHYHFDTKEGLLVTFVDYLLDRIEANLESIRPLPPRERLAACIDWFVLDAADDLDRSAFHLALLEMRAQAPYNDRFRERFRRSDDRLRTGLEEILEDGIGTGVFAPVDAQRTARLLVAALDGARIRQLTLGDPAYTRVVRAEIERWLVEPLLMDPTDPPRGAPTDDGRR